MDIKKISHNELKDFQERFGYFADAIVKNFEGENVGLEFGGFADPAKSMAELVTSRFHVAGQCLCWSTKKFPCPCCGYKTLVENPGGTYAICSVCFWEDDLVQLEDPDYEGGANKVSLKQGQRNFIEFGACEKEMIQHVRKPKIEEERDVDWKILE